MGLETHIAHRDKFELDEPAGGFQLAFPCCVCKHRHGADTAEPCSTCDHNANAVPEVCKHENRECTYESDDGEFERWRCKDCGERWGVEIAQ